jgi:RNA polymerase sigma-70 factor (ECF subfamily)
VLTPTPDSQHGDFDQTDPLLERAGRGDRDARQELLARHRERLRQMVNLRLDRRLAARVDASDIVQEALIDAELGLDDYIERHPRPLPFYPWLRQFAWDRLIDARRKHLNARNRSVTREEMRLIPLPDESAAMLVHHLVSSGTSPSGRVARDELRERVHRALDRLAPHDREVLVLRHLEQLTVAETAAVLEIGEEAVKSRHRRALERLRSALQDHGDPDGSEVRP